ncbi:MAG: hypothetical protein M3331_06765, partial [Actinomycetota bacterium]|nr:hypothetical protein [Actinomycetota bacterium]
AGEDGRSRSGGSDGGEKRGDGGEGPGALGDETSDGASVPAGGTEAPGTIAAEQAADGGLSGGAAIAIGFGALALIIGAGFFWQRRAGP